ncbi:MAG TPA: cupin domain-containing protein [Opitutaceae bacterium]|jgi:uncharacterized cupin superfamily protein
MKIINVEDIPEESWGSPKGTFGGFGKEISLALGRDPKGADARGRHPFDLELARIPPGKKLCPFHSHSAQWEHYLVYSGKGQVRSADGYHDIKAGDSFVFGPGEPHQLLNPGDRDLVVLVVADNPVGESCHYPDSGKWLVRSPEGRLVRSESLDYFDGEE